MVKISLVILTVWTFFQGFFSQFTRIIPQNVDLLDEFILFGLTFYWVIKFVRGKLIFKRTPFDIILLFLLFYVLISSLLNSQSPFISLLAIRDTFQYILLFYILVELGIKEKDLQFLFKIIFTIAVFQFFVIITQLASNFSKTGSLFLEDLANGTFGIHGSHKLGYFMGMMMITSLVLYQSRKEKKYLVFTILFSITLVITSCRGSYFITGATLLFIFKGNILRAIRNFSFFKGPIVKSVINFSFVFFIMIFFGLSIYYFNKISTGRIAMISPDTLLSQQLGLTVGTGRRIGVMFFCFNLLKNSDYPLIGVGPGKLSKTSGYFAKSNVMREIEYLYQGSEYILILNQLAITAVEYGLIGSIIIFLVFFKIYLINGRSFKRKENQYINNLNFIFKGVFLIYILGAFAEKVFEIQEISFYFWFLFSMIYILSNKKFLFQPNKNVKKFKYENK